MTVEQVAGRHEIPGVKPRLIEFLSYHKNELGIVNVGEISAGNPKAEPKLRLVKTVPNLPTATRRTEQEFSEAEFNESIEWFEQNIRRETGRATEHLQDPTGSTWYQAQMNRLVGAWNGRDQVVDLLRIAYPLSQMMDKWRALPAEPLG